MLAHVMAVFYALTSMVDNLDDPECLVEMLLKTAANHFTRGIDITMFNDLGISIVSFLVDKLGANVMDDEAVNAWKKTYGVIVSVVQQGFDKAAAK